MGKLFVEQLPTDTVITSNDRFVTSGQPGIPPGQFVGVVASIEDNPAAATQTVILDQLVSFYQTSLVELEE